MIPVGTYNHLILMPRSPCRGLKRTQPTIRSVLWSVGQLKLLPIPLVQHQAFEVPKPTVVAAVTDFVSMESVKQPSVCVPHNDTVLK